MLEKPFLSRSDLFALPTSPHSMKTSSRLEVSQWKELFLFDKVQNNGVGEALQSQKRCPSFLSRSPATQKMKEEEAAAVTSCKSSAGRVQISLPPEKVSHGFTGGQWRQRQVLLLHYNLQPVVATTHHFSYPCLWTWFSLL